MKKPKIKRVKAWLHIFEGKILGYLTHNLDGKCPPCVILIDGKHLKGVK